jgi:site-specific recombinase XerD
MEHYLIWHEAEGHSRKTEPVYRKTLRPFFAYLKEEQQVEDLGDLTLEHLRAWLVWLRNTPGPHDRPRSSKTIESYCRQVKAFLHWLYVEELLDHNPAERLKLPKAEKKHLRVFTDEEIKRLHEVRTPPLNGLQPEVRRMLTARNRAVLWMLLDTGMRAEELCRIRFADLDRRRGTVYIMGKGAKERKLLLGQRGYHYLSSYLDHWRGEPDQDDEPLILTDKRVSAHTCRHWYAIRFLLKGGKLFALQRHLGHETLEMVKIYAYFTDQDAEEEKRKYSPADDIEIDRRDGPRRGYRTA